MKTIYITEAQKKKLKKAVAAQDQVGGKVNAGVMDAVVGGMCESKNIQKWYRGFDSKFGIKSKYTPYLLWLTDDLEYAKEYGDSVMEFDIDFSKCNGSVYDLPEDIDYYDGPDRQTAKELLKQGINSYCFYANQDSSYCMCLWDKSPIVSSNIIKIDNSLFENIEDDKYELGAEKGDISPYYHVNESNEEMITLYHGVNRKGLEYNLEQGCFVPRVCSEGGPKAVWLSEKQYNYEFTFAFDFPKSLVEQLSNVDYIFTNKIGFNDFNCRLVRTSISSYLHDIVVETNILNDKLSKIQFRYFPDLGIELWKEFKQYPNILERFINPYIEKYQQLSESINISKENRMVDINQVINSPEFKAWFGNSKVVDKNGNPLIVHHGSPKFEGDKFSKEKVGLSMNSGEGGVFCTTQDMSWAKRFSYPASPGTFNFTVKLDYSHPGDILSGFLKLEHPLDFFHLTEQDWKNIMNMARDTYYSEIIERNPKKWLEDRKLAISQYNNHRFVKHDISSAIRSEFGDFGEQLKRYGYDGYIASMYDGDEEDRNAIEYCFIEPNQFKSIYSLSFSPESDSIYENKSNINIKEEKTNFGKVWYINAVNNSFRFALYKYNDDSNCLYLSNVFVEESSRRQGLGNYILNLTNDFAKKMNVKEIFLKVKKGTFMCKWYEKNGYEYFSDDETDSNYIWMVKEVKQNNIIENKKKIIKNDKGEIVPDKCDKCGGEIVLQIHGEPVYVCKDCGKYFGTMPFHLKENKLNENIELEIKPDEVDLSSFNIKKKLNPKFWIDGHLDSRIRLKLLDISDDFIEYLGIDPDIVKDVIMTGSLANFNWNEEFSDIDLHVLLDYSDIDENTEFVKQYFMAQKNAWNNEHEDLKIFGFPIEVYVQDVHEKHDSSGVYSLDRDKWLREPDREVLASSKVNKELIKNKVSDYVNKIDKLLYIYKKVKNDEYKLRKLSEKIEKLWEEIKNSRKIGFEKSGGKEINNNNIVFKSLRRQKYLDKLYDLKTKTYDKLMSL